MRVDNSQLTIYTVSFQSKAYLEQNCSLANRLNPAAQLKWIIAQNSLPEAGDDLDFLPDNCKVVDGCELDSKKKAPGAYQHGSSLNKILPLATTRFALVLDPDFYIVRRNWAAEVTEHMLENRLAFLGAPWHPKWHNKARYFPCAHCLFIDLAQVNRDELDFRPGQGDVVPASQAVNNKPGLLQMIYGLLTMPLNRLQARSGIGKAQDTGYNLHRRYGADPNINVECFTPVYKAETDYQVSPRWLNQLLDAFLPDRLSYTPKRAGYYTPIGFRELGYTDTTQYGWEEFAWKNQPFGFHLRSVINRKLGRKPELEQETATLAAVLSSLTN
jgi:hypothetical protein